MAQTLSSPLKVVSAITPANDSGFVLQLTDYIGAVDPDATKFCWADWIIVGAL
ncbi:MAG TPA: hypothetical protein VIC26_16330 [Marinagarivorans sp.]